VHAIILAGGKGTRLLPYTEDRPKSLLPFGAHTLLEISLRRLHDAGVTRVTLCVSHFGQMIEQAFGSGQRLGLDIDYVTDKDPLGTAAPLLAVRDWTGPAVVANGDVLSQIDFAELHHTHRRDGNDMTVVVHRMESPVNYGVVHVGAAGRITSIREKPRLTFDVSAGIYVVEPRVRRHFPEGLPLDMPDLIAHLLATDRTVRAYRFDGPWHDVGTPVSYATAQRHFAAAPDRYLRVQATATVPATGSLAPVHLSNQET
jgi:NDP-mannose synthase